MHQSGIISYISSKVKQVMKSQAHNHIELNKFTLI